MFILITASILGIALAVGVAIASRSRIHAPSSIEARLDRILPGTSSSHPDSPFERREYDWTVEYDSPVGSQRIVLNQNPSSFGELPAFATARATAMLHRGSTIEVWTEHRSTGERVRIDALRMETRRAA